MTFKIAATFFLFLSWKVLGLARYVDDGGSLAAVLRQNPLRSRRLAAGSSRPIHPSIKRKVLLTEGRQREK